MSSELITCASCGAQMRANDRFCSECGHVNALTSAQFPSEEAAPSIGETFATPMSPPAFEAEAATDSLAPDEPIPSSFEVPSSETRRVSGDSDTPPSGAPTINVGQTGYAPPPGWQPGPQGQQAQAAPVQPPAYSPYPIEQGTEQPQSLGQYSEQPRQPATQDYAPPQPPYQYGLVRPTTALRDPTIALLLELIGYAGFLGIGHLYAGRVTRGILLMVGWWLYGLIAFVLTFVLIGCFMFLAWPIVPILSGLWIKNDLDKELALTRNRFG